MKVNVLIFLLLFLISCSHSIKEKETIHHDCISVKEERYPTGTLKTKSFWYKGKKLGYMYEYDSLGNISEITSLRLLYPDSIHVWDPELDTVDIEKKESYVNCIWKFNSDGSLDSTNSNFYVSEIKDSCLIEDSVVLKLYVKCHYFKNNRDSLTYEFYIRTSDNKEFGTIQYRKTGYTEYVYHPQKKGVQKIYYNIYEKNITRDSTVDYQGCSRVNVK
ncbi:MAG: hypothetical protein J5554_03425 [Paludibacteraceae bacterium]|nr:hypothetical protein [Paludibacteraceae bacterium]